VQAADQGYFHWDASLLKFSDSRGGVPRGNAEYNLTSTGVLSDPYAYFYNGCAPDKTLGGRPATSKDEG
jgi:hypothetical protein